MTGRDLYTALLRFGGSILLFLALTSLYFLLMNLLRLPTSSQTPAISHVTASVFYLIFGTAILRFAKRITDFLYRHD